MTQSSNQPPSHPPHHSATTQAEVKAKAANIKLVVFDVDGVLTDGSLIFGDDGQEYKAFHSRDGHGMKMLQASGVEMAFITGRMSEVVKHRARNVKVSHVYQGQIDKLPAYEKLKDKLKLQPEEIAVVGDDVVDLPIMLRSGLAIAVSDAHPVVKQYAHWITPSAGGKGAAREVCELIMEAQGSLERAMMKYLS